MNLKTVEFKAVGGNIPKGVLYYYVDGPPPQDISGHYVRAEVAQPLLDACNKALERLIFRSTARASHGLFPDEQSLIEQLQSAIAAATEEGK